MYRYNFLNVILCSSIPIVISSLLLLINNKNNKDINKENINKILFRNKILELKLEKIKYELNKNKDKDKDKDDSEEENIINSIIIDDNIEELIYSDSIDSFENIDQKDEGKPFIGRSLISLVSKQFLSSPDIEKPQSNETLPSKETPSSETLSSENTSKIDSG